MSNYNLKSIKEEFKQKGIFYTPPELANLIKSYIDIDFSEVYDPTCGDGGLLNVFDDSIKKYGQEINESQLEVAKEKLINFDGVCGDTLKEPAFKNKKFDLIMANPPFGIKWNPIDDERFNGLLAPPGKADYAFILHCLHYLSDNGKAYILEFPGVLYRGNKEGKIRQWLVDNNYIEKIVNIPGDTFVDTKIATCLIILNKNKNTTDIIFEDRTINKQEIIEVKKIIENGYSLSVNQYVYEEIVKEIIDPIELQEKARNKFLSQLRAELNFDKMVCEFENMDFNKYLDDIKKVVNEFYKVGD